MASQLDVVAGDAGHGRHDAAGQLPRRAAEGLGRRGRVRRRPRSPSGTGTATRSPTPTATGSARPAWSSPAPRRTGCWSSSPSCRREVHPFFVGTQAHPELKSRPTRPHPLFAAFVQAAVDYQECGAAAGARGRADRHLMSTGVRRVRGRSATRARSTPGRVISLRRDTVAMPGGGTSVREVVHHPGAVGVVALDDDDRVVMLRQYRHPSASTCGSCPPGSGTSTASRRWDGAAGAGRGDPAGRGAVVAAGDPAHLARLLRRAGAVYLAEGLTEVARPDGFVVEHEELDMTVERVPLAEAVQWVFDGEVRNALRRHRPARGRPGPGDLAEAAAARRELSREV